jgi:hypothetical protein
LVGKKVSELSRKRKVAIADYDESFEHALNARLDRDLAKMLDCWDVAAFLSEAKKCRDNNRFAAICCKLLKTYVSNVTLAENVV